MLPNPFEICYIGGEGGVWDVRATVVITDHLGSLLSDFSAGDLEVSCGSFPVQMNAGRIRFPLKVIQQVC
jgi:hypothetical protein